MANRKVKVDVSLKLLEETLRDILYKLAADGTDLNELLEGFINDLVCGRGRHGSDEVDRARAYYDRCSYGLWEDNTFLRYLLEFGEMECFFSVLEDIEAYKEWVNDGEDYEEELREAEENRDSFYDEWAGNHKTPPQSKEEAFEQVKTWHKEYEKFMKNCKTVESEEVKA